MNNSVERFCQLHRDFRISGAVNKEEKVDWPSQLPFNSNFFKLWADLNPKSVVFETGILPVKLLGFDELVKGQEGYRWIKKLDILVKNDQWQDQYVVFGDDVGGGRPLIIDVDKELIFAGLGPGEKVFICERIDLFINCLCDLLEVVYVDYDIWNVADDNGINREFYERVIEKLRVKIGEDGARNFMRYFYL